MPKVILVPATGNDTDLPVFDTALSVARLFHAHLQFIHVQIDINDVIAAMAGGEIGGGGGMGRLIDEMEQDGAKLAQTTQAMVEAYCARNQVTMNGQPGGDVVTAEWKMETGRHTDWLAAYGRAADLTVVGRAAEGGGVALDLLEAALMDTGRPLLIAAAQTPQRPVGPVVIAWKDTPEAARAVAGAMAFIRKAEAVLIVSVQESDEPEDPSCNRLLATLRWHNRATSVRRLTQGEGGAVRAMLDEATRSGAFLIVMGGYGHGRLREAVFGGFTQSILENAELPVLMAH